MYQVLTRKLEGVVEVFGKNYRLLSAAENITIKGNIIYFYLFMGCAVD